MLQLTEYPMCKESTPNLERLEEDSVACSRLAQPAEPELYAKDGRGVLRLGQPQSHSRRQSAVATVVAASLSRGVLNRISESMTW